MLIKSLKKKLYFSFLSMIWICVLIKMVYKWFSEYMIERKKGKEKKYIYIFIWYLVKGIFQIIADVSVL